MQCVFHLQNVMKQFNKFEVTVMYRHVYENIILHYQNLQIRLFIDFIFYNLNYYLSHLNIQSFSGYQEKLGTMEPGIDLCFWSLSVSHKCSVWPYLSWLINDGKVIGSCPTTIILPLSRP